MCSPLGRTLVNAFLVTSMQQMAHSLLMSILLNKILNFSWEAQMLILFFLSSHLKRLLTSSPIYFLKTLKEQRLIKNRILFIFLRVLHHSGRILYNTHQRSLHNASINKCFQERPDIFTTGHFLKNLKHRERKDNIFLTFHLY